MICSAISSRFFLFFFLIEINTDGAQNLLSVAHNVVPTEGDHQAFAGPGPEGGPIFVTTKTSSNVAV
jgi:hypothetical protein